MNDYPYLIALALIEQDGNRLMPLGGKSLKSSIDKTLLPGEIGKELSNQLLLRIFQKSESNPLRRVFGERSLLLIQIPMLIMQERIPIIKANWINHGNNHKLCEELKEISIDLWSINFKKEAGIVFTSLK